MVIRPRRVTSVLPGWLLGLLLCVLGNPALSADNKQPRNDEPQDIKKQEAAERAAVRKHLGHAKTSLADAIKTAVGKLRGGKAVDAYFEVEGKALLYEVEVIAGSKHQAMLIDSESGHWMGSINVEHQEKIEREMKEAVAKAKLTLLEAVDVALKKHPNAKAFDVHPDKEQNKTVIEVEVLDGKKMLEIFIDPTSGAILAEREFKE